MLSFGKQSCGRKTSSRKDQVKVPILVLCGRCKLNWLIRVTTWLGWVGFSFSRCKTVHFTFTTLLNEEKILYKIYDEAAKIENLEDVKKERDDLKDENKNLSKENKDLLKEIERLKIMLAEKEKEDMAGLVLPELGVDEFSAIDFNSGFTTTWDV